jgi:hypothetical protein
MIKKILIFIVAILCYTLTHAQNSTKGVFFSTNHNSIASNDNVFDSRLKFGKFNSFMDLRLAAMSINR